MSKKSKVFRIASFLLVLCFISTVMISGTLAKYTSEYSGQDTALVAKWQFKVTDGTTDLGAGASSEEALDLFSHSFKKHINDKNGDNYIIAPGVNDEFTIKMSFLSDVDAKVTVNFSEGGTVAAGLPIEYLVVDNAASPTNSDWVKLDDLSEKFVAMLTTRNTSSTTPASSPDNTFTFGRSTVETADVTEITQVVKWRWAFDADEQDGNSSTGYDSNDSIDTGFGETSASDGTTRKSYILNVSVKAEQIQPETD